MEHFSGNIDRRALLRHSAGLVAAAALNGMPLWPGVTQDPLAPKAPHFRPRAKSVIFLFMYGGPSQVDTFDYKPNLYGLDGKTIQVKTRGRGGARNQGRVVGPKWHFRPGGQCGKMVSDLFPHLRTCVDDMAFVHSMHADSPIHGSAMLMMNSGRLLSGHPALGSWVTYALGTQNQSLPGFVVMLDPSGGPISGAKNWTSGYMPAAYQGVVVRTDGEPILDLTPPDGLSRSLQRRLIDHIQSKNARFAEAHAGETDPEARMRAYELAYRMQDSAPIAFDVSKEPAEVHELYGLNREKTRDFGRKCLLARRLVERGVRFVQVYAGGAHNDDNWDAHGDLVLNHERHAGRTDQPIAGLLKDLKRTGLLDETLVIWTGEFGRQPTAEYAEGTGRDHNSYGFTLWMAGGGIKGGTSVGQTDELGAQAVEDRYHVKNLHATILRQLGLEANRVTFPFGGLDQRIVGVEGAEAMRGIV